MPEQTSTTSDLEQMEAILEREDLGHLAMTANGELYLIPINYAYAKGRILFHCALEGRKLDMIRANASVCFEVSAQEGRPAPHPGTLCDASKSAPFESVICWGVARIVEDPEERCGILNEFQARFNEPGRAAATLTIEATKRCWAVEITVSRMTGRCTGPGGKQAWEWSRA